MATSDNSVKAQKSRELEKELRDTVERYEMIFKATNDVLYDLDLRTGKVVWNEALYTQYGYNRKEATGSLEWWTGHIHPDDALRLEHEFTEWFDGSKNTWQAEYRFKKANNGYVFVRDRGVVQRAKDGMPLRIIGSFLDITQQKQLDRAKNEFISLISHQLRTPLTVIRINSEMMETGILGDLTVRQKEFIHETTEASIRLIKLVSDILNISRVELGHVISNPVPCDVNERLLARIHEVRPLADSKEVVITFKPDKKVGKVHIDTTILDQIAHNLLTNAIRYTKAGQGKITVSFKPNKHGHILKVSDNGIGIPKLAQANIFERFYRANNTANIKEQGTGLGLYLVRLMTEAIGGKVWFESQKGKRTSFYVMFPKSSN